MNHKRENQVELEELRKFVLETDGRIDDKNKDKGNEQHDWDLSEHLRSSVNPNVVHVACSLADKHRLFTLEHNNGWQEVKEHLHDAKEVKGSSHTVEVLCVPSIALLNRCGTRSGCGVAWNTLRIVIGAWTRGSASFGAVPVPLIKLPEGRYQE